MIERRTCQNCKKAFIIEPEDFSFYEKICVPPPTWCWQCRAMRRMSHRNMHYLYKRICAATGKTIFTLLPPKAPMPVYSRTYWASDAWDAASYAMDYDFNRPFFEQIRDLYHAVPWTPPFCHDAVNSEYCQAAWVKNCYLCFDTGFVEDSAYSVTLHHSKQCLDTINCESCELCYYCINTNSSYKTFFSRNCTSCIEVWCSQDCIGCTNCFGCTGLRNKNYHIFNKPYTKDAYTKALIEMKLDSWAGLQKARREAAHIWAAYPVKYRHSVRATDCTGDYLYNADKLRNCFFAGNAQNCANSQSIIYGPIKDSMDATSCGVAVELFYETICSGVNSSRVFFSFDTESVAECQYVINCSQSNDLFGCVGLRSKQYCILNKQYSKEAYGLLKQKIIEHMSAMPYTDAQRRVYAYGEFFPPDMSPYGYGETQAYEYFPLKKEQAVSQGFRWQEPEWRNYAATKSAANLPETIGAAQDDILESVVRCLHDEAGGHFGQCAANCATAFRIIPEELRFYRKMHLPLPRLCFNCRHFERVAWRNAPILHPGKCACLSHEAITKAGAYKNTATHPHGNIPCTEVFETSYAPEQPEIVYCENCYNAEVA